MTQKWINVNDSLPEIIYEEDGGVNCVFVKYEKAPCGGSQYGTSNTVYLNKYPERFLYWMYIEEPKVVT